MISFFSINDRIYSIKQEQQPAGTLPVSCCNKFNSHSQFISISFAYAQEIMSAFFASVIVNLCCTNTFMLFLLLILFRNSKVHSEYYVTFCKFITPTSIWIKTLEHQSFKNIDYSFLSYLYPLLDTEGKNSHS